MERKTQTIDVNGKPLGRAASEAVFFLRGKSKPTFSPHLDEGDKVVIKNVDKIKFTGKKFEQKEYKKHTNYLGHLRVTKMKDVFQKSPRKVFQKTIYNMLPKNKLRREIMKRLSFE